MLVLVLSLFVSQGFNLFGIAIHSLFYGGELTSRLREFIGSPVFLYDLCAEFGKLILVNLRA